MTVLGAPPVFVDYNTWFMPLNDTKAQLWLTNWLSYQISHGVVANQWNQWIGDDARALGLQTIPVMDTWTAAAVTLGARARGLGVDPVTSVEPQDPPDGVLLEARGISKRFGSDTVLKNVDLTVHDGEVLVVIGPSGSGKSTLLRCLNYLTARRRALWFDGRWWRTPKRNRWNPFAGLGAEQELRHLRGEMGMVFQLFNVFPHPGCGPERDARAACSSPVEEGGVPAGERSTRARRTERQDR